jgi:hypothetical protein
MIADGTGVFKSIMPDAAPRRWTYLLPSRLNPADGVCVLLDVSKSNQFPVMPGISLTVEHWRYQAESDNKSRHIETRVISHITVRRKYDALMIRGLHTAGSLLFDATCWGSAGRPVGETLG